MTTSLRPRLAVDVHQTRLDNGLRVVVSPDPRLGFAVVNAWHGVGSLADPVGRSGLAHLAEHVCFDDRNSAAGARGHGANATTSYERLDFVDVGPVESLPAMLARVPRRIASGVEPLSGSALARHRDVVVQEIRQREDTARFGSGLRRSLRLLFGADHPFGRPALGSPEELVDIAPADVAGFVADGCGAANSVVSVVGSVSPEEAIDAVAAACSHLPPGPVPTGNTVPAVDIDPGREEVEEGQPAGLLRLTFAMPPDGDPLADAGEVLMAALAGAPWTVFGSRFATASGVLAVTGEHVRCAAGPSVGMLRMALPPQAAPEAIESAVGSALRQVIEHGLPDDVRAAAIARCRKQRLALACAARTRAEELCQQASWHGDAALINDRTEPRARAEQLCRVAADALPRPATVVFHPAREEEPAWIL